MSDEQMQVFNAPPVEPRAAFVTEEEVARFEDLADEYAEQVTEIMAAPVAEEHLVEIEHLGLEVDSDVYRVVDIRGRFTSPDGNWAIRTKDLGQITHYNGPATPARAWQDPLAWIKFINDLHAQPGRFAPGWTFDGVAYHEFYFNDVVYLCRNYRAVLPHCGNTEWNFRALAGHIAIGGSQRANQQTLRTATARVLDHFRVMKLGRSRAVGHQEVGSSACPGTLMQDFVRPFRAGQNPGGSPRPAPQPSPPGDTIYRVRVTEAGQIGAYRDAENARRVVRQLRDLGVKHAVEPPLP